MIHKFYYLTFTPSLILEGEGLVNGFPLFNGKLPANMTHMELLNIALAGSRNHLWLDLHNPTGASFELTLHLKTHEVGSYVTPDSGEPIPVSDRPQAQEGLKLKSDEKGRLAFQGSFASPGLDFSGLLFRAEKPSPEEAIKLGHTFLDAFLRHDLETLKALQAYRLRDLAIALAREPSDIDEEVTAGFTEAFKLGLPPGWKDAVISAKPWCEGRLLELVISGSHPLFRTRDGEIEMRVFVGQVAGRLQIVR